MLLPLQSNFVTNSIICCEDYNALYTYENRHLVLSYTMNIFRLQFSHLKLNIIMHPLQIVSDKNIKQPQDTFLNFFSPSHSGLGLVVSHHDTLTLGCALHQSYTLSDTSSTQTPWDRINCIIASVCQTVYLKK